jgi:hypothetical protein
MIDFTELKNYFEQLATQHKLIAHNQNVEGENAFLFGDVEILMNDVSGCNSNSYTLLFEYGDLTLAGANEDSLFENSPVAIIICKSVPERDYTEQNIVEDTSYQICRQILARMKKNRNQGLKIMEHIDFSQMRFQKVYGFGNNHFGWRMEVNLQQASPVVDDPAAWIEEE